MMQTVARASGAPPAVTVTGKTLEPTGRFGG
jgi:hypothetical protein